MFYTMISDLTTISVFIINDSSILVSVYLIEKSYQYQWPEGMKDIIAVLFFKAKSKSI